jgi:hypothetical protein
MVTEWPSIEDPTWDNIHRHGSDDVNRASPSNIRVTVESAHAGGIAKFEIATCRLVDFGSNWLLCASHVPKCTALGVAL